MENGVNAMTDADVLAGCSQQGYPTEGRTVVSFSWPDGFGCTARIDDYCDVAKAQQSAIGLRREHLRRKGIANAG